MLQTLFALLFSWSFTWSSSHPLHLYLGSASERLFLWSFRIQISPCWFLVKYPGTVIHHIWRLLVFLEMAQLYFSATFGHEFQHPHKTLSCSSCGRCSSAFLAKTHAQALQLFMALCKQSNLSVSQVCAGLQSQPCWSATAPVSQQRFLIITKEDTSLLQPFPPHAHTVVSIHTEYMAEHPSKNLVKRDSRLSKC